MWTKFYDMSSGGDEKLGATTIWIEADKGAAVELFEGIFNIDPYNVTCDCCGCDYIVYEANFMPDDGDLVVTQNDIKKYQGGNRLNFDS